MSPSTDRPEACAIAGSVHVFVGGYHQVMSITAAETLVNKIADAIEQAKQQEAEKA